MDAKDFGSLANAVQVDEYETHVEVRPTRKLEVRELMVVNDVVMKHGGKVEGVCEFGAWFTIPLHDKAEQVDERWIPVSALIPPPFLVRAEINEGTVQKIVDSIKKTGKILEPLVVRPSLTQKDKFEYILGSQRLTAAKRCGWQRVRCNVYPGLSDVDAVEWQIIENEARSNLNDYERGRAMKELLMLFPDIYRTQEDLAVRFGHDQCHVSRLITHFELIESEKPKLSIQQFEQVRGLDERVTRELVASPPEALTKLLVVAAVKKASVREAKGLVAAVSLSKEPMKTGFQKLIEETRDKKAAEKARQEAVKRKLQRQFSKEMANDVFARCEAKKLAEDIMVGLFAPAVRLAWLKLKELGLTEKILDDAEAEAKPEAEETLQA